MADLWTLVAAERGALSDDLAGLTPEQWGSPSLCPGWTVRHIVAHLTAAASTSPGAFVAQFARAGFNFDKYANAAIARRLGGDTAATLAGFRAVQGSTTAPPGPKPTWIGEVVVHSEDIRRPLGSATATTRTRCAPPPTSTGAQTPSSAQRTASPGSAFGQPTRTGPLVRVRASRDRSCHSWWP